VPRSFGSMRRTSASTARALGGLLAAAASQSDRAASLRAMVWRQLLREGFDAGRDRVARLMRRQGLEGVRRGRRVRTTLSDKTAPCPLDRVNRRFTADRPNTAPPGSPDPVTFGNGIDRLLTVNG
jgi:transposase InsO family protein